MGAKQKALSDIINDFDVGLHIYHFEDIGDNRTLTTIFANRAAEKFTPRPADLLDDVHYSDDHIRPSLYAVKAFPLPENCSQGTSDFD